MAVKSTKRLLMSNVDAGGSLNNDNFLRAMLTQRNTPDADCKLSPSQVVFGHPLRDTLSFAKNLAKFSYSKMSQRWKEAWKSKEDALRTRYVRNTEGMQNRKSLPPLKMGDRCFIQNQHGNHPKRWHSSGEIMETLPFDKYVVKVDGSRRVTSRNRRYLRLFKPISTSTQRNEPHIRCEQYKGHGAVPADSVLEDKRSDDHPDPMPSSVIPDYVIPEDPGPRTSSRDLESPGVPTPSKTPLAMRRLRTQLDGVKHVMANPLGRRGNEMKKKTLF